MLDLMCRGIMWLGIMWRGIRFDLCFRLEVDLRRRTNEINLRSVFVVSLSDACIWCVL